MKKPNFLIILRDGKRYVDRWYLIPQNPWFNIYLHRISADDNQVLHDHPWNNLSIILKGGYYETRPVPRDRTTDIFYSDKETKWFGPGSLIFRKSTFAHRLALKDLPAGGSTADDTPVRKQPCWSLFITGPVARWVLHGGKRKTNWGFHTRHGWITHARLIRMENGVSQITPYGEEMMK
jgi:hypothetical protein